MVGAYELSNDQLFLGCVDGRAISVYRLNASNLSKVMEDNFDEEAAISPEQYSSLKLFGVEVRPAALARLRRHLCALRIRVNRQGFCYHLTEDCVRGAHDIEYYRLNDLLDWSLYGVKRQITFNWDRHDILSGGILQGIANGAGSSLPQPRPTPPPPPTPPRVSLRQRPVPSSWFKNYPATNIAFEPAIFPSISKNSKFVPLKESTIYLPENYTAPHSLFVYGIERFDVKDWYFLNVLGSHDQKARAITYYDGKFNPALSPAVYLPFSEEVRIDCEGFLAVIEGLGLKFVVCRPFY
ncbi:hypothetical protein Ancab_033224 [Ancistrocladus abbreviatus]